ncbi:MAG: hypothetical protein NUV68_05755 [Caldiserica bacterium]|jgi:hypothetical protein|nr:hypothetical protein [Caldisericota bacterium]MDH7562830.1 hypothetical protein [Caldisericota bacterium]
MDKLTRLIRQTKIGKIVIVWFTLASTVTFMLFIIEEAYQTASFAAYYANSAKQYSSLPSTIAACKTLRTTGLVINYAVGWLNPLSFVAFNSFFNIAAPSQIAGMEALLQKASNTPVVEEELHRVTR